MSREADIIITTLLIFLLFCSSRLTKARPCNHFSHRYPPFSLMRPPGMMLRPHHHRPHIPWTDVFKIPMTHSAEASNSPFVTNHSSHVPPFDHNPYLHDRRLSKLYRRHLRKMLRQIRRRARRTKRRRKQQHPIYHHHHHHHYHVDNKEYLPFVKRDDDYFSDDSSQESFPEQLLPTKTRLGMPVKVLYRYMIEVEYQDSL